LPQVHKRVVGKPMAEATRVVFVTGEDGAFPFGRHIEESTGGVHVMDISDEHENGADSIVERATAAVAAGAQTVVLVTNTAPPFDFAQRVAEHGMVPSLVVVVSSPADVAAASNQATGFAGTSEWSVVHRTDEVSSSWTRAAGTASPL